MTAFPGVIHKQPNALFGVSFPDFPGCISAADDLSDIPAMAKESLELPIEGMIEDGLDLPEPRALADVQADPDGNDFQAVMVVEIEPPSRQVRANTSLDERLPGKIDSEAEARGMTRSGFPAVAAREMMTKSGSAGKKAAKGRRAFSKLSPQFL